MKRVILLVNFGRAVGRRQAHHQFQQKVIQRQKKFTFDKELAKTTGNIPHDQNEMSLAAAHFARYICIYLFFRNKYIFIIKNLIISFF
jgi:hypothetical protein